MTREEEIKYASKDYVNYLLDKQEYHNENYTEDDIRQAFEKGAKWADNNPKSPWISVEDNLPCNHEELIDKNFKGNFQKTLFVIALLDDQCEDLTCMINDDGRWKWIAKGSYTHWMPIPKLLKK